MNDTPAPTHLCRSRQGRSQPLCGAQGIPDPKLFSDHELKRGRITCPDCLAAYPAAKTQDDARAEARGMRYLLYDARRPLVLPRAAPQGALRVLIIDRLVHADSRWNIEACAQWLRAGRGGLGRLPLRPPDLSRHPKISSGSGCRRAGRCAPWFRTPAFVAALQTPGHGGEGVPLKGGLHSHTMKNPVPPVRGNAGVSSLPTVCTPPTQGRGHYARAWVGTRSCIYRQFQRSTRLVIINVGP